MYLNKDSLLLGFSVLGSEQVISALDINLKKIKFLAFSLPQKAMLKGDNCISSRFGKKILG